jgi:hypothetical protein
MKRRRRREGGGGREKMIDGKGDMNPCIFNSWLQD